MADHNSDARPGELFRDRARLLWIAGVVADLKLELLAEHAARGVDVGDRLFGAVAHLSPESRLATRHRSCGGNRYILCSRRAGGEDRKKRRRKQRHRKQRKGA